MRDAGMRYHTGFDAGMGAIIAVGIAPGLVVAVVSPEERTVPGMITVLLIVLFWYLYRTTHYILRRRAPQADIGPAD